MMTHIAVCLGDPHPQSALDGPKWPLYSSLPRVLNNRNEGTGGVSQLSADLGSRNPLQDSSKSCEAHGELRLLFLLLMIFMAKHVSRKAEDFYRLCAVHAVQVVQQKTYSLLTTADTTTSACARMRKYGRIYIIHCSLASTLLL